MSLDALCFDVLYLLLLDAARAGSLTDPAPQQTLLSLAQSTPALYEVYQAYELRILQVALQHLCGRSLKLALQLARAESRHDPKSSTAGDVELHRSALQTFPQISRLARFFQSRDMTNVYAGPHLRSQRKPLPFSDWINAAYTYANEGLQEAPPSPTGPVSDPTAAILFERYLHASARLIEEDVRNAFASLPGDRNWCAWWDTKSAVYQRAVLQPGAWRMLGEMLGVWQKGGMGTWEEDGTEDIVERGNKRWAYAEWRRERRTMRIGCVVNWIDGMPSDGGLAGKKEREPSAGIRFAIGYLKLKAFVESFFAVQ